MDYKDISDGANPTPAVKRCGPMQVAGALVIISVVCGSIFKFAGHPTYEFNSIDTARLGMGRFMGALLCCIYGQATLYNHLCFVDVLMLAKPAARPDLPAKEEIWASTPTEARLACVSTGGWCVCWALTNFLMPFFEPQCGRGLVIAIVCVMVWWNVVWYGGMYKRIDAIEPEKYKLPASNFFFAETIMEIFLIAVAGYLAFGAHGAAKPPPGDPSLIGAWSNFPLVSKIRVCLVVFLGSLLSVLYGKSTLAKHTAFVSDFAKPVEVDEGMTPDDIWACTPTVAKFSAVESGGWATAFGLTMVVLAILEPSSARGLCKCFAICMVWWNCVWYAGMYDRVDYNDQSKRPWTNWFKAESIQEIVLFCITGYLGFICP